ncbi:hypothetical protein CLAFUW4_03819 [Fulvia fulva]|uniref:Uncharacterized protein n=1 Tax=Passalora fulva TaxID=5499 RepID=A0A9Q8LB25_PASFU|nr:uncharacterized protein CLAFUR5_03791 [Fulvia fulva]KAK4631653.1 hypothetical protein CLAFUR4_03807 [Fulvia fulva]KAK4632625.1 hypothetical protein CLAFUR0_03806 [Fulvia fulva]UJO14148.1 hypothetical protein CLAFUR5_03791 [Fulvia fulva]WPV11133.1 hypothetical protein CLAFUW4_03819 [Fulvia fulva]WPV26730.1 hypothetical protein CLAFUW7_03811 [Fulvia fulva]
MASNNGAGGERAAEQTKGIFKGIGDATESLRKNVNAFADDMIGGKSNTHANTADRDREYTTGHVAGSGTTHDASTGVGASHPHDRPGGGPLSSHDTTGLTGNHSTTTTGPGSHFAGHGNTAGTTGTGLTDAHNTAATGTTNTANTASTGIHPDAQKTGAGIGAAVGRAGEKIEEKTSSGGVTHTSTGHGATYTRQAHEDEKLCPQQLKRVTKSTMQSRDRLLQDTPTYQINRDQMTDSLPFLSLFVNHSSYQAHRRNNLALTRPSKNDDRMFHDVT